MALLLLVLFTVSFIPKKFFHDVMASHTDAVGCEHRNKEQACIHQQGFNCAFNDLVVTAPYVSVSTPVPFVQQQELPVFVNSFVGFFLQQFFFGTESRGPPFMVV